MLAATIVAGRPSPASSASASATVGIVRIDSDMGSAFCKHPRKAFAWSAASAADADHLVADAKDVDGHPVFLSQACPATEVHWQGPNRSRIHQELTNQC